MKIEISLPTQFPVPIVNIDSLEPLRINFDFRLTIWIGTSCYTKGRDQVRRDITSNGDGGDSGDKGTSSKQGGRVLHCGLVD